MNKWKKLCNRGLSFLLATAMTLSLLPAGAMAAISYTEVKNIAYDAATGAVTGTDTWNDVGAKITFALLSELDYKDLSFPTDNLNPAGPSM